MSWELSYGLIGATAAGLAGVAVALMWWRALTPLGRVAVVAVCIFVGLVIGGITRGER